MSEVKVDDSRLDRLEKKLEDFMDNPGEFLKKALDQLEEEEDLIDEKDLNRSENTTSASSTMETASS